VSRFVQVFSAPQKFYPSDDGPLDTGRNAPLGRHGNPPETIWSPAMSDIEIISLFDSTNITLAALSAVSGRSVADLKNLLMGGAS